LFEKERKQTTTTNKMLSSLVSPFFSQLPPVSKSLSPTSKRRRPDEFKQDTSISRRSTGSAGQQQPTTTNPTESDTSDDLSEVDSQQASTCPQHEQFTIDATHNHGNTEDEEEDDPQGVELVFESPTNLDQGHDAVEVQLMLGAAVLGSFSWDQSSSSVSSLPPQEEEPEGKGRDLGYLRTTKAVSSLKPAARLPTADTEDIDSLESSPEAYQALRNLLGDDSSSLSTHTSSTRTTREQQQQQQR
jgi:hypothetical protein